MAFFKSLTRFLSPAKPPGLELAAFGKHPGWNDHTDDLGLNTEELVNAKRLLYIQGISQNIDMGAWEKLEPSTPEAATFDGRLDLFRHDFLWQMPPSPPSVLLAGRLWSSVDGKGRDKYPMVLCTQLTDLPAPFATRAVLPFLAAVQERCMAATTANTVREIIDTERETLRGRATDNYPAQIFTAKQLVTVANHPDLASAPEATAEEVSAGGPHLGFLRIVYQFAGGLSGYRVSANKSAILKRPEQLRLPTCGLSPQESLLFWLRFAQSFLDDNTSILLFAPDQGVKAPWVDMIVGDPAPQNLFCIKAGTKAVPLTSAIPYTLDPSFVRAVENHLTHCASLPDDAAVPSWPI